MVDSSTLSESSCEEFGDTTSLPSQKTNSPKRICLSDKPSKHDPILRSCALVLYNYSTAYGPGNDIGCSISTMGELNDEKRFKLLTEHFIPNEDYHFPTTTSYGRSRKFQLKWLKKYPGLVYSPFAQGGFCIYCALFSTESEGILVHRPLTNFVKASYLLSLHFESHDGKGKQSHLNAVIAADNFRMVMQGKKESIAQQMSSTLSERICANRLILKSILETIILCGKQNISLRGHRDDASYLDTHYNCGNFQALLDFRANSGDNILKDHFKHMKKNATYRSKTIQNELIDACGEYIRDKILTEIRAAKFFSFSCDEVADCSNEEQLAIVLRFVDQKCDIREEFLSFVKCTSQTTGEDLSKLILETLTSRFNLLMENCRGQTYDGAGNMAGCNKGVATRIQQIYPHAMYTHCSSHILNLCLVKCMEHSMVRNMMNICDRICVFYEYSPKRQGNLEESIDRIIDKECHRKKLKQLCRTRWVERLESFWTFLELYEGIHYSLQSISCEPDKWNSSSLTDAKCLMLAISDFEFIISLVIAQKVLSYTEGITSSLQSKSIDIIAAYKHVNVITESLRDVRRNIEQYNKEWYTLAKELAQKVQVEPKIPRLCKRQLNRHNIPAESPEEYYRKNLSIPFVEHLLSELVTRFSLQQQKAINVLYLVPSNAIVQQESQFYTAMQEVVNLYKDDLPSPMCIQSELHCWYQKWKNDTCIPPCTTLETLKETNAALFPNIHVLLRIICTLQVTSCECERSFSALRRLKTYLRSTMGESRMDGLALMMIHYSMDIDLNKVIDIFALKHPRRMELVDILSS